MPAIPDHWKHNKQLELGHEVDAKIFPYAFDGFINANWHDLARYSIEGDGIEAKLDPVK